MFFYNGNNGNRVKLDLVSLESNQFFLTPAQIADLPNIRNDNVISVHKAVIKQNDTAKGLVAGLLYNGKQVDITDARVSFLYEDQELETVILDGTKGLVLVDLNERQTEKAGFYRAEIKVRYKDGRLDTFPDNSYLKIRIYPDLS